MSEFGELLRQPINTGAHTGPPSWRNGLLVGSRTDAERAAIVARMQARAAARRGEGESPSRGPLEGASHRVTTAVASLPPAAHPRTRRVGTNPVPARCACRSIRVFPTALAVGPIRCEVCGGRFQVGGGEPC